MLEICWRSQRQLPILFLNTVTKEMCKVVQKFHVVPPTACVLKDLSFSTAECFVQLINFAYQFLHKEIINVRRFGCATQLIVHNYVKNTIKYMVWVSNSSQYDDLCFLSSEDICCPRDLEFFFAMVAASTEASFEAQSTWFLFNVLKPQLDV